MGGKQCEKRNCGAIFEQLELRRLCSVVNVNPGNFIEAVKSSHAGDTVSFAAGNYALIGSVALPSDRTYVGNGATLTGDGSGNDNVNFTSTSNIDFSGFVLDGAQAVADSASGLKFHNNSVENVSSDGLRQAGMNNSQINQNTFTSIAGTGIYGYPGNNNQFDDNRFDYVFEPIHFSAQCDNTDVSGNYITHATRIGIELQEGMTNLTVNNNYMSDWLRNIDPANGIDSHMGISCATGGSTTAPYADQGENITISGNVIIQNGPGEANDHWAKSAIESLGDLNIKVTDNFAWGWGTFLLNGTGGGPYGQGPDSSNNTVEASESGDQLYGPDGNPWPTGKITGSGDRRFSQGPSDAPAWPAEVPGAVAAAPIATPASTKAGAKETKKKTRAAKPHKAKAKPKKTAPLKSVQSWLARIGSY